MNPTGLSSGSMATPRPGPFISTPPIGFYADIYDSEGVTSELRSALELLLFSAGDMMIEASSRVAFEQDDHLRLWSRRLDQALATMASHLARTDEEAGASGLIACSFRAGDLR